ncbi:MAG: hypothetical protein MHM6MM_007896, partial [Cercozoa sp. M6MM]
MVDTSKLSTFVDAKIDGEVIPKLQEYIRIPNQSPDYDPEWATNGLQEQVVELYLDFIKSQQIQGLSVEVIKEEGLTPLIFIEIAGTVDTEETVMMYGHYDKQPPLDASLWFDGLDATTPEIRDGKLYGRGGADDGYSMFSAMTCIKALQEQGVPHARIVMLVEGAEESGREDLEHYVQSLAPRIGQPSLIICLDSGAGNYTQLWVTTSLRGVAMGNLNVEVLTEGVHSGSASGIVPESFRVLRQLLDRLENPTTGQMHEKFCTEIPEEHHRYAREAAATIGEVVHSEFPFVEGMKPVGGDSTPESEEDKVTQLSEMLLNRTWRPTLCVTGIDGLPPCASAGNVLRPVTKAKLSVRLPPTVRSADGIAALKELLENTPAPYGAKVTVTDTAGGDGWAMPKLHDWLEEILNKGSQQFFPSGDTARFYGEGGSIPFMGMLTDMFPTAKFVVTGVLG